MTLSWWQCLNVDDKTAKTVINMWMLSPTHFVSYIPQQHRCNQSKCGNILNDNTWWIAKLFVEKFLKIHLETSSKCCTLAILILLDRGVTQHQNAISMLRIIVIDKTEFNHLTLILLKIWRIVPIAVKIPPSFVPYAGFFSFLFQEIWPSLQAVGWTTWIT